MTPTHPIFVDTTLRDGEQASGVAFTLDEKLSLMKMLSRMGIREFEVGTPAMGELAMDEIRAITSLGIKGRMIAWCRAMQSDIELARQCGVNAIHLSFPLSQRLLNVMDKSPEWVISQVPEIISSAREHFEYVSIGAQDATRADIRLLGCFTEEVVRCGANRLRIADTVGLANPFSTHELISWIRSIAPEISIEYHAHNDLGMACANTFAAWMAGADALSTTINGLGERAGNAPFEEVVMAIEKSAEMKLKIKKSLFPKVCSYVEQISGRRNALSKPVVGELSLTHESGIHTKYLKRDRSTYQLIKASEIGLNERGFKIGKHTCCDTLRTALEQLGVSCRSELLPKLLERVREWATINKRDLCGDELILIYQGL